MSCCGLSTLAAIPRPRITVNTISARLLGTRHKSKADAQNQITSAAIAGRSDRRTRSLRYWTATVVPIRGVVLPLTETEIGN
jgi:hypothetical protein